MPLLVLPSPELHSMYLMEGPDDDSDIKILDGISEVNNRYTGVVQKADDQLAGQNVTPEEKLAALQQR